MMINEKLLDDYLYYKPGDTYSFTYQSGGYVTGGGKSVFFTIFVPKLLSKISNISITGTLQLRQKNGYPLTATSITDGTFTIDINKRDNAITFNMIHNTAYTNIENNSAVGVDFVGNITFS